MFRFAVLVPLLFAAALLAFGLGALPPLAALHLAMAGGVLPLIFAAMLHFVPVLTRTGAPHRGLAGLPGLLMLNGAAIALAFSGRLAWLPGSPWLTYDTLSFWAGGDLLAALVLGIWMARRARACLGAPHPGGRWYLAALAALGLALAGVPVLLRVPALYAPLRAAHLHLNTLGFIGLAALGTLPLLLPTALARPDPKAAGWLRRHLLPVAGGVLLIALGAALMAWPPALPDLPAIWPALSPARLGIILAVLGALAMALPLAGCLYGWQRRFAAELYRDGAAVSLLTAAFGLLLLIAAGIGHALGAWPARAAIPAFMLGVLLPLVLGALSQLLPVWRLPGPLTPQRAALRACLVAGGGLRAGLCLVALLLAVSGILDPVLGLGFFVVLHFLVALGRAVWALPAGRGPTGSAGRDAAR